MVKSRKLAMVRRETQKERSVSFTKRRQGLFNKAAELCMLCDAQIAVLVASPSKDQPKRKMYSFGNASVPAVVNSFVSGRVPFPIDDSSKRTLLSLRNEVEMLESLNSGSNNNLNLKAFDDWERLESVEELQKLVDALDNILHKAKSRLDCEDYYANVTFNELRNCNMLSSTEEVVENFKCRDSNDAAVEESSNLLLCGPDYDFLNHQNWTWY